MDVLRSPHKTYLRRHKLILRDEVRVCWSFWLEKST